LKEIKELPRTDLIILKAEQLNNTKWIRIKCSDDNKEEFIGLN